MGLIWLVTGVMGALPFYFSGTFPSFVDCLFESVSGFTTTGATILTDIEAQPRGILFWRAFTHWMGGMGVLVLLTALLPSLGIRSHYLTQAETPGPVFSKLVPKQSQTSKILYGIYCAMTLAEVALLKLAGMPLYDSFIHAFSTAGTGGFSNRNASVGAYGDPVLEMIIAVFALLFSINFAMYFLLLCRRFRAMSCAFSWWWWACPPPSSPSTSGTCTRGLSSACAMPFFRSPPSSPPPASPRQTSACGLSSLKLSLSC